jgi:hypothetical protein
MPNQPKTPIRTFRIPEREYRAALEKARSEGIPLTDVIRQALRDYVSDEKKPPDPP